MNNKRILSLFFPLVLVSFTLFGQEDTLTLRQCLKAARENSYLNARFDVLNELMELKTANVKATNLPSVSAYGKAWYQSDAVSIALPNGGGIEIDPFQYNAGIEANQKLFDGGMAGKARQLESSLLNAETGKINSELYQLTQQVSDLFLQALLLQKKLSLIELKQEILEQRMKEVNVAVDNGILKRNDSEGMQAEVLIVRQQKMELNTLYLQLLASLKILTGLDISGDPQFAIRDSLFLLPDKTRPEELYFLAEQEKLESMARLQQTKTLPKLYAYGQAGYSYPGLNFYENQSDYYYIVGAKLSWTLYDWKQNRREVEIIRTQKESVAVSEADFRQKMAIAREKERINQAQLQSMIALDEDIIRQRVAVTRGSEMSLQEGTITGTDYLEALNTEIKARIDAESRKLELQRSFIQLRLLEGIDLSGL